MCFNCYMADGAPRICTEATRRAHVLIAMADPFGPLHVVVEDENYDDENLEACRVAVYADGRPEEVACFEALVALSEDERVSAGAMASGYIDPFTGRAMPAYQLAESEACLNFEERDEDGRATDQ